MNGKKISWGPKYEVDKHESNSKQHDASSGPSKCPLSCEAAHLPTLTLIRRNIGMKSANNFDNLLLYNLQERTKKTSPSFLKKIFVLFFFLQLILILSKKHVIRNGKVLVLDGPHNGDSHPLFRFGTSNTRALCIGEVSFLDKTSKKNFLWFANLVH